MKDSTARVVDYSTNGALQTGTEGKAIRITCIPLNDYTHFIVIFVV